MRRRCLCLLLLSLAACCPCRVWYETIHTHLPHTHSQLCRGVLGAVMHLIQSTGDASEFSSANSLLLKFMRTLPPQQLLHCAGSATSSTSNGSSSSSSSEEEAGLAALLTVARQLMASKQADGGMAAGVYLAQLVKLVPQQLCGGPMSPALAAAVAGAAAAASSNGSAAAAAAVPAGASCVALLLHDVVSMMTQGRCSPVGVARLMEFVVRLVLLPVPGPQGVVEMLASMAVPNKGSVFAMFVGWGVGGWYCGAHGLTAASCDFVC